jgi:hypothetical protein
MEVLVPKSFLELIEPDGVGRVVQAIERAVAQSFEEDQGRLTRHEIRRRYGICENLIVRLRGDLGWGLHRALDHLPHYLRCELDGQAWEPDPRTIWMPEDGR